MPLPCSPASVLIAVTCILLLHGAADGAGYPRPFSRLLKVTSPPMSGNDVVILQNLLQRTATRTPYSSLRANNPAPASGEYTSATASQVTAFQTKHGLSADGEVGPITAGAVLRLLSRDGYKV